MEMGKRRRRPKQTSMWIATHDLPRAAAHPFYTRLNQNLDKADFDSHVESLCHRFYADEVGRPGLPPDRPDWCGRSARSVRIPHQRILNHRGRLLTMIDLQHVWGHIGACVGIRREDLHRILLDGAAGVPIQLGSTVRAVTQTPENASVEFEDGLTRSYRVVIGADGINSSIRRRVFDNIQPRPVGQISWRSSLTTRAV
jgi:hypothetical protein